jgi:hypothetical protein
MLRLVFCLKFTRKILNRIRISNKDIEKTAFNLATGIWDKEKVYHWLKKISSEQPKKMKWVDSASYSASPK